VAHRTHKSAPFTLSRHRPIQNRRSLRYSKRARTRWTKVAEQLHGDWGALGLRLFNYPPHRGPYKLPNYQVRFWSRSIGSMNSFMLFPSAACSRSFVRILHYHKVDSFPETIQFSDAVQPLVGGPRWGKSWRCFWRSRNRT